VKYYRNAEFEKKEGENTVLMSQEEVNKVVKTRKSEIFHKKEIILRQFIEEP
jgi:hypothetical protein